MGSCGLFVVSRVMLSDVCGFVMLCVIDVWRVCVWFSFNVLACCDCDVLCDGLCSCLCFVCLCGCFV